MIIADGGRGFVNVFELKLSSVFKFLKIQQLNTISTLEVAVLGALLQ